jgi:membrane protease YdiL (CAAX protease family)
MGIFKQQRPITALAIVFISLIVCLIFQTPVLMLFGSDLSVLDYWELISVQVIGTLMVFGGAICLSVKPMCGKSRFLFGNRPTRPLLLLIAVLALFASQQLVAWASYVNALVLERLGLQSWLGADQMSIQMVSKIIDYSTPVRTVTTVLVVGILPAVLEEAYFRGLVQRGMSRVVGYRSSILPILLTSVLFSLVHGEISAFLPRLVLGIVLGVIYARSHNLIACIVAHAFNNLLVVVALAFSDQTYEMIQSQPVQNPGPIGPIISLGITFILLVFIRLTSTHNSIEQLYMRIKKSIEEKIDE